MGCLVISLVLFSCVTYILCLKILLVFPVPAHSHYTLGNELGKGLARAGHEVSIISSLTEKNPPKKYRQIVLSEFFEMMVIMKGNGTIFGFNMYDMGSTSPMASLLFLNYVGNAMSDGFFQHPKVQKLLKSDEHFDVVIVEEFFIDAMKILSRHFKAHLILFCAVGPNRWINNLVGNPEPPSYVSDIFLSFTGNMNYYERTYNFLFGILSDLHLYLWFYPQQGAIMKKYYPNAPDINELQYNVSLVLLNSHESVNHPVPHVPNIVDIGGFHVNQPKELPKDVKVFMDNAKKGVIYFSMGSHLVPSQMPKDKKDAILKILGTMEEQVLWKWDEDTLNDKPGNVMISKWFPQQAVLAHPNCKLFITHGGHLSTTETIYFGVPILAIPVFGDQKLNAARAASLGYGKSIEFSELNEINFADTLNQLLNTPSFRENAQVRSRIMRDRPVKPMDLAVYWIEYIVRHNGAPHLRVAGINLSLYKYYMLDVLGAALTVLILGIYLLSKICGYICRSKNPKSKANVSISESEKKLV